MKFDVQITTLTNTLKFFLKRHIHWGFRGAALQLCLMLNAVYDV